MKLVLITLLFMVALEGALGWKAIPLPNEENRRLGHTHTSKSKSHSSSSSKSKSSKSHSSSSSKSKSSKSHSSSSSTSHSSDSDCDHDYSQLISDDAHARACLIVEDGKAEKGQKLILGDCDQAGQGWRYDNGLFRSKLDDDMCMQASDDEAGAELRLYCCDRDNGLQKFIWDYVTIELENSDSCEENYCVAFKGDHSNINEDPIVLKPCDESDGTDNWSQD